MLSPGVSLFELTVVLAVAGILTTLFIYSTQYMMLRTRVARVNEEHRVLTRALQNYEADHGMFPETRLGLHALEGPIAYMVRIPSDPFAKIGRNAEYVYVGLSNDDRRWLLISCGPDGDGDVLRAMQLLRKNSATGVNTEDDADTLTIPAEQMDSILTLMTYDPTNGLRSGGDIVTTSR
jgi:type II secretory pathway pseudopilin PulG